MIVKSPQGYEIDPERTDDVMVDFGYQRKRSDIATDQMQTPRVRIPGATADQFPLPPSTFVNATRGPNSPITNGMNGLSGPPPVAASSSWASNITSTSTNEMVSENKRDSFMPPSITPAATFRQMPLLNTDLKNATVEVVGSHIRPNDKGKEVLCFVIGVNVVGKEGWTVCVHIRVGTTLMCGYTKPWPRIRLKSFTPMCLRLMLACVVDAVVQL